MRALLSPEKGPLWGRYDSVLSWLVGCTCGWYGVQEGSALVVEQDQQWAWVLFTHKESCAQNVFVQGTLVNVVEEAESEGISIAMKGEATVVVIGKRMPRQLPNRSKGVWYRTHVCEEREHNLRRAEEVPPGTVGPRWRMTFVIPLSRIT